MERQVVMSQGLRRIAGVTLALRSGCGGGATLPAGPEGNKAPQIQGITVDPPAVLPGASAMITVTASDPDGDRLLYAFRATNGTFSIPDANQPARAEYRNNGVVGADTITVTVRDSKNASTSSSANIAIDRPTSGGTPSPNPNPTPSPSPDPTPSPGPKPNPTPGPTPTPTPAPTPTPSANRPPTVSVADASCHPRPSQPCTATLVAAGSDPDGDPISLAWSGCANGVASTSGCSVSSLGSVGVATVTVADGKGGNATATANVVGTNVKPTVVAGGSSCSSPLPNDANCTMSFQVTDDDTSSMGVSGPNVSGACVFVSQNNVGMTIRVIVHTLVAVPSPGLCHIEGVQWRDVWGATGAVGQSWQVNVNR